MRRSDAVSDRLLYGTDEPVSPALELQAGPFAARLQGTRLGPIMADGHEVWHAVDFLYRDPDWGTPKPVVDEVVQGPADLGLDLLLRGHIDAGARLDFEIRLHHAAGALTYCATATPQADLPTNRTGVVLLHPQSVCGGPIEVEHVDGRTSVSTFPRLVAPWPPFMLVRGIRHSYAPGAWAACRLEGDDFELEDQRNNADASFKTYSRSNLMPRPYLLRRGAVLRQSVQLRLAGLPAAPRRGASARLELATGPAQGPLPRVGTAIDAAQAAAPDAACAALAGLRPAFLHLGLPRPDEQLDAAGLARLLAAAGCGLRLDVEGVDPRRAPAQLADLSRRLRDAGASPAAVAVFPSTPPVVDAARGAFPDCPIGGGTPAFFTQLNRLEDLGRVDFLAFTTCAVVHGADDGDVMSGLQSLQAMAATARARHGHHPLHVGPSAIGARRSPLGAQPPSDGTRRLSLARRDPRTAARYGAAWALGYVVQMARAGVEAVTLFDLMGDAALVVDGEPTPAFDVLRRLAGGGAWREVQVPEGAPLAALQVERPSGPQLLLANLGPLRLELARPQLLLEPYAVMFV